VLRLLSDNGISPRAVADIGCGAGELLKVLQRELRDDCEFWGFDILPQALAMAETRKNDRLHFKLGGLPNDVRYKLILALDVVEHVEDCFSFPREIKGKSLYKIFEMTLDLLMQSVVRAGKLMQQRRVHGHIHYFSKELAIALLTDTGFEIVDFFTPPPRWIFRLS
jgi:hypothetical protein